MKSENFSNISSLIGGDLPLKIKSIHTTENATKETKIFDTIEGKLFKENYNFLFNRMQHIEKKIKLMCY